MMSDDLRIVLVGAAKAAHDSMLAEVKADARTSVNSSKLINWIVKDYFEHYFDRRKKSICKAHINSRKLMLAALRETDPKAQAIALMEIARTLAPAKEMSPKEEREPA